MAAARFVGAVQQPAFVVEDVDALIRLSVPRSRSSVSGNVAYRGTATQVERQVNDGLDRTTGDNQAFGDDSIAALPVLEVVKQSRIPTAKPQTITATATMRRFVVCIGVVQSLAGKLRAAGLVNMGHPCNSTRSIGKQPAIEVAMGPFRL